VLIYGPVGVGKTTVLEAIANRARDQGVPCGASSRTNALSDFTRALLAAYPAIDSAVTQRVLRTRLRNAVEARPGFLLLDDVGATGSAFKGALRALRGTGMGILLAADVDCPRDHERVRRLHLTHHEIELPPLHGSTIRALVRSLLATADLPFQLRHDDLASLVSATGGLPGRAARFVDALQKSSAWRDGRPRCDGLRMEAIISAAERYGRYR
jgi:hypothetical protein